MRKKAFTLIELLVVISIIALLVAILMPALNMAKQQANAAVCGANLHRLGVSLDLYAQDYRDFYPRALPLAPGANASNPADWQNPWPSNICPMFWQAGYPSLLAPYLMDLHISTPTDYMQLPGQMNDSYISHFSCPGNKIKTTDTDARKCGYPLDYGLHNYASQNRQGSKQLRNAFLAADQTWGLSFIPDSGGPNAEAKLQGWWNPFVHPNESIKVLLPDYHVESYSKEKFIRNFKTDNPPVSDPL